MHSLTPLRTQSQSQARTLARLRKCMRTLALTFIPIYTRTYAHTDIHSFIHTILHTRTFACTHSFVGYLTLPFSFSYVFVDCLTLLWVALLCLLSSHMYLQNAVDYLTLPIRCLKFRILWVTPRCLFALQL